MNEYIKNDNNIKEEKTQNKYICEIGGNVALTIEHLGDNIYHAKNDQMEITAQIKRLNDFNVSISIIKYKYKNGSQTLKKHYASWLAYMLQEKGFIQKSKFIEPKGEQNND